MAKKIPYWKTPKFWKESERQEKHARKVDRLIEKREWKELRKMLKESKVGKLKKSDWL